MNASPDALPLLLTPIPPACASEMRSNSSRCRGVPGSGASILSRLDFLGFQNGGLLILAREQGIWGPSSSSVDRGLHEDPHSATAREAVAGEQEGAEDALGNIPRPGRGQEAWEAESSRASQHGWVCVGRGSVGPGLLRTPGRSQNPAWPMGRGAQKSPALCVARGP